MRTRRSTVQLYEETRRSHDREELSMRGLARAVIIDIMEEGTRQGFLVASCRRTSGVRRVSCMIGRFG